MILISSRTLGANPPVFALHQCAVFHFIYLCWLIFVGQNALWFYPISVRKLIFYLLITTHAKFQWIKYIATLWSLCSSKTHGVDAAKHLNQYLVQPQKWVKKSKSATIWSSSLFCPHFNYSPMSYPHWFPNGFPHVLPWFPYDFPMFCHDFPMISPCFAHEFSHLFPQRPSQTSWRSSFSAPVTVAP